jgi:hypothetical protein
LFLPPQFPQPLFLPQFPPQFLPLPFQPQEQQATLVRQLRLP